MKKIASTLVLVIVTLFAVQSPALAGQTITVCPSGASGENGCDYIGGDGIQEAVDAAPVGTTDNKTTILIKTGQYSRQNFTEYTNADNKKRKCFVDSQEKNLVLQGEADAVLDGRAGAKMGGVCAKGGQLEIKNLDISGFKRDYASCFVKDTVQPCSIGSGIQIEGNANVGIFNSNIYENKFKGISIHDNNQVEITNSNVYKNGTDGIQAKDNSRVEITNSNVYKNGTYGIRADNDTQVEITNSNITFNYWNGIYGDGQSVINITNSNIYQNNGNNNAGGEGIGVNDQAVINLSYSLVVANRVHNWREYGQGKLNRGPGVANDHGVVGFVSDAPPLDFHLLPSSRAVDAGDPAVLDPDGSRSDTGVYGGPGACDSDPHLSGCVILTPTPTAIPTETPASPTPTPPTATINPTSPPATPTPTEGDIQCSCDNADGLAAKQGGDFDCSGTVDIGDFTLWVIKYIQGSDQESLSCSASVSQTDDFNVWLTGYLNKAQS